jgi:hypothetical protein
MKEPSELGDADMMKAAFASRGHTHACVVNFNADGTLWACVPSDCVLTSVSQRTASPEEVDDLINDMQQAMSDGVSSLFQKSMVSIVKAHQVPYVH